MDHGGSRGGNRPPPADDSGASSEPARLRRREGPVGRTPRLRGTRFTQRVPVGGGKTRPWKTRSSPPATWTARQARFMDPTPAGRSRSARRERRPERTPTRSSTRARRTTPVSPPSDVAAFGRYLDNLTLATAQEREQKRDLDAAGWRPSRNQGWFAETVLEVKRRWDLSVDPAERRALMQMRGTRDLDCIEAARPTPALPAAAAVAGMAAMALARLAAKRRQRATGPP